MAAVSGGFRRWLLQQGGELLDTLSCRWGARLVWLAGQAGAPHAATIAQRVCALSRRVAPHIPVLRRNQAGSATICLMPHIRSRLLGRARRRYGADQHHQPRHTACATLLLLLLRVPPSAVAVSVLSVLSVRCGGCSLGPLSADRMCDCVPASLSESVSTRTATECACMPERNPVSRRFIHAVTIGAPRRLLSPLLPVPELPTTQKRSGTLRRAAEQPQQQLPGSCPPVPASAQHPMQPSSSSLPQAH